VTLAFLKVVVAVMLVLNLVMKAILILVVL
jgi:hypothetical protein